MHGHQRCCLSRHPCNVFGPTGSVLGPLLFILYMADFADIAAQYNLTLHAFADDNQLYKPENVQLAVASVQQYVTAIKQWISGWPPADSGLTRIRPN